MVHRQARELQFHFEGEKCSISWGISGDYRRQPDEDSSDAYKDVGRWAWAISAYPIDFYFEG
jgi:hypothetical protein